MSNRRPPREARALWPVRPEGVAIEQPINEGVAGEAECEGEIVEDGEHPAEEARKTKIMRDPGAPTRAEREAHAATHLPFRIWCEECA